MIYEVTKYVLIITPQGQLDGFTLACQDIKVHTCIPLRTEVASTVNVESIRNNCTYEKYICMIGKGSFCQVGAKYDPTLAYYT